ncbi:MAG: hypothetical protein ABII12_11020 [Planctomycetota bacterium]
MRQRLRRRLLFGTPLPVLVLVCTLFLASDATFAQTDRGRREPPPDGPWNRKGRKDPTDPAGQAQAAQQKAQKYYDQGIQLIEKGRIRRAKAKFKAVIGLVGQQGVGQAALGQLMQIHAEGMSQLAEARRSYEIGEYRKALDVAKKTKSRYANILGGIDGADDRPNIAKLAVELIKKIENDPKAIEAIQEFEAAKRFARVARLEKATEKDPAKWLDLFKLLDRIALRYPECPTGDACAKRVQAIKGDKPLYRAIKLEQQRRFIASALQLAEQYERDGRKDLADAQYDKLKKRFPGKSKKELRRMARE